jgi:hypothetical protein
MFWAAAVYSVDNESHSGIFMTDDPELENLLKFVRIYILVYVEHVAVVERMIYIVGGGPNAQNPTHLDSPHDAFHIMRRKDFF